MKLFFTALFFSISFHSQTQTKIPTPVEKDIHPKGYYGAWLPSLNNSNAVVSNPNSYWHYVEMEYFNRFLSYAKMQTNESREILAVFMDGFNYNKHYFCHQYNTVFPLNGEEYNYIWKMYAQYEKPIMDAVCDCVQNSYDQELMEKLSVMREKDQRYRQQIGIKTFEQLKVDGSWQKQLDLDAENIKDVKAIIEKVGYPDRSKVGYENESIAFLVIQHSNLELMKKTLPLIKESIEKKNLKDMYYAYLYDRIQMLKGEPQYYGTQSDLEGKLYKIKDANNINARRKKMGMRPLKMN